MIFYIIIVTILGIVAARVISIRTRAEENIEYTRLDRSCRVTNIVLSVLYICLSPFYMFIGLISEPVYDGVLGFVGWIVSAIISSASFFAALGIGLSVFYRKRGKSKLSFAIQFLGMASIGISFLLFAVHYGNLLSTIN